MKNKTGHYLMEYGHIMSIGPAALTKDSTGKYRWVSQYAGDYKSVTNRLDNFLRLAKEASFYFRRPSRIDDMPRITFELTGCRRDDDGNVVGGGDFRVLLEDTRDDKRKGHLVLNTKILCAVMAATTSAPDAV